MEKNTMEFTTLLKNFVVFEGIDGAGTTTQINLLKSNLKNKINNGELHITAEPTRSPTGKFLREILKGSIKVDPVTSAYLFAADRNEHISGTLEMDKNDSQYLIKGIKESCQKGNLVVSDRYIFSSLAYQSASCGKEIPMILNGQFPLPEILFFFDLTPEESLKRVESRGEAKEIFETVEYLTKTRKEYLEIIDFYRESYPEMKIVLIDATKSREEISKIIMENILELV